MCVTEANEMDANGRIYIVRSWQVPLYPFKKETRVTHLHIQYEYVTAYSDTTKGRIAN